MLKILGDFGKGYFEMNRVCYNILELVKCHKTYYIWGQISKVEVCNLTLKRSNKLIFSEFISTKHIPTVYETCIV
jgi:hypothetical protein